MSAWGKAEYKATGVERGFGVFIVQEALFEKLGNAMQLLQPPTGGSADAEVFSCTSLMSRALHTHPVGFQRSFSMQLPRWLHSVKDEAIAMARQAAASKLP